MQRIFFLILSLFQHAHLEHIIAYITAVFMSHSRLLKDSIQEWHLRAAASVAEFTHVHKSSQQCTRQRAQCLREPELIPSSRTPSH